MPTKVLQRDVPVNRGVLTQRSVNIGQEDYSSYDENAQDQYQRKKSRRSVGKPRKKQHKKRHQEPQYSDEDSVESSESLSPSFRSSKENHRRSSNSGAMVATRMSRSGEESEAEEIRGQEEQVDIVTDTNTINKLKSGQKTLKLQQYGMEIARLRKELEEQKADKTSVLVKDFKPAQTKPSKMNPEEKAWFNNLGSANKLFNWSSTKFCNSDKKLVKLTANIFDKWNLKEFQKMDEKELEQARIKWIAENQDLVRVCMNDQRNYAQSQCRSAVVDRIMAEKFVPTPEDVLACALRDESLHTDESKHKIFDFYHDVLLFKVVGKDHWDGWIRHYDTISGAVTPGTNPEPRITANTEAFLVALYENCWVKWQCIAEQKASGIRDPKRTDPRHKTEFIDSDAGQAKWGGWNKKGRARVAEVLKMVEEARKKDHVKEMEEACLARVRKANNIDEEDKKAKSKKKKRKRPAQEVEEDDDL